MKRKTITLSGRLSASLVALSLAFQPMPAYALRTETAQEAGLEETLTQALKDPAQAFKEFTQEVTGLATSTAAGLEESLAQIVEKPTARERLTALVGRSPSSFHLFSPTFVGLYASAERQALEGFVQLTASVHNGQPRLFLAQPGENLDTLSTRIGQRAQEQGGSPPAIQVQVFGTRKEFSSVSSALGSGKYSIEVRHGNPGGGSVALAPSFDQVAEAIVRNYLTEEERRQNPSHLIRRLKEDLLSLVLAPPAAAGLEEGPGYIHPKELAVVLAFVEEAMGIAAIAEIAEDVNEDVNLESVISKFQEVWEEGGSPPIETPDVSVTSEKVEYILTNIASLLTEESQQTDRSLLSGGALAARYLFLYKLAFAIADMWEEDQIRTEGDPRNMVGPLMTRVTVGYNLEDEVDELVEADEQQRIILRTLQFLMRPSPPAGLEEQWKRLAGHASKVGSIAFDRTGTLLGSAAPGEVRLWDTLSGQMIGEPIGVGGGVTGLALLPDQKTVALGGRVRPTFRLLDLESGEIRGGYGGPTGPEEVTAMTLSPDGKLLALAVSHPEQDGALRPLIHLISAYTQGGLGAVGGQNGVVQALAFSQDSQYLASASSDGTIRLYQKGPADSYTDFRTFQHPGGVVTSLAFSPSGHFLASANWNRTVQLWDVKGGFADGEPLRFERPILGLAFWREGSRSLLLLAGGDGKIRLWDVGHRKAVSEIPYPFPLGPDAQNFPLVAFSSDARRVALADHGGAIWMKDIVPSAAGLEGVPSIELLEDADELLAQLSPAILFIDFDDTIWTGFPHEEEVRFAAEKFQVNANNPEEFHLFRTHMAGSGKGWDELVAYIHQVAQYHGKPWQLNPSHFSFDDYVNGFGPMFEQVIQERRLTDPDQYLVPGINGLLQRIQIPIVVLTGGVKQWRQKAAEGLGIWGLLDDMYGGGRKAERISEVLTERGLRPHQAIFVGDSPSDIRAGRQAGIFVVAYAVDAKARQRFKNATAEERPHAIINGDFKALNQIAHTLHIPTAGLESLREALIEGSTPFLIRQLGSQDLSWRSGERYKIRQELMERFREPISRTDPEGRREQIEILLALVDEVNRRRQSLSNLRYRSSNDLLIREAIRDFLRWAAQEDIVAGVSEALQVLSKDPKGFLKMKRVLETMHWLQDIASSGQKWRPQADALEKLVGFYQLPVLSPALERFLVYADQQGLRARLLWPRNLSEQPLVRIEGVPAALAGIPRDFSFQGGDFSQNGEGQGWMEVRNQELAQFLSAYPNFFEVPLAVGLEEERSESVAQPSDWDSLTVKRYFRRLLEAYARGTLAEGAEFFSLRITGFREGLAEFEIPVDKLKTRRQRELGLSRILDTLWRKERIPRASLAKDWIQPVRSWVDSDDRGTWRRVVVRIVEQPLPASSGTAPQPSSPTAGLEAGPPQFLSSSAVQGSVAPSEARKSEAVGPSVSHAAGRPGAPQERGGGRAAAAVQRILVKGTEDRLVIFTPATALTGLELLAGLESPPGKPLQVAFVVEDSAEEAQVRAGLEQVGLAAVEIVNLSVTGQTVWDAVADLQIWAWSRAKQLETFVVDTLERFWDLGRWLRVPRISWRTLLERVGWVSTATQA